MSNAKILPPPLVLGLWTVAAIAAASQPAFCQAVDLGTVTTLLQGVVDAVTGTLGKTISTIVIAATFLGWFFGHVDFRQALIVAVAIAGVQGAAAITDSMWGA